MAAAGAITGPVATSSSRAATPANTIVMGKQIDDIIALDPAQACEFTSIEVGVSIYRKLVSPDLDNLSKIGRDLAEHWDVSNDGRKFTFRMAKDTRLTSGRP